MRAGKSLSVSSADAGRLRSVVQDRNAPQKQVWRAEIVLLTAEGVGTTRTRRELTREIVRHTQRIQATLEESNIKVTSVISDILGLSGRRILKAIVGGEGDPSPYAQGRLAQAGRGAIVR